MFSSGIAQPSGWPAHRAVKLIMASAKHQKKSQSVRPSPACPYPPGRVKKIFGSSAPSRSWWKTTAPAGRVYTNRTAAEPRRCRVNGEVGGRVLPLTGLCHLPLVGMYCGQRGDADFFTSSKEDVENLADRDLVQTFPAEWLIRM